MAFMCKMCSVLCVIFLLISTFSSAYSSSDIYLDGAQLRVKNNGYYNYAVAKTNHALQKRSPGLPNSLSDNATIVLTSTTVSSTSHAEATEKPSAKSEVTPIPTVNSQGTEMRKEDKEKKPYDTKVLLSKNLGVNGTGIRKNITKEGTLLNVTVPTTMLNLTKEVTSSKPSSEIVSVAPKTNQTLPEDDDLNYPNPFEDYNKTLTGYNITKDHHQFYNSSLNRDPEVAQKLYWVDMKNKTEVKVSDLLSQSHRRAATVRLSFDFPFYGHLVRNITIATGGFLYTGEYVHSWLAATQYIAPLMANFDTSLSNDSFIKYLDNGTAFTVQWENVSLQDKPAAGNFTFQTTLYKNGDIVFVYENIPITIENILDDHHPVKVGLSDAYISDRTIFFVRRKTIYEYHRVHFSREDIKNWTSIYLSALPTCLSFKDCTSCVTKFADLKCTWCPGFNRCSSGMDRNRQGWLSRGCDRNKVQEEHACATADAEAEHTLDITNGTNELDPLLPHYKTSVNHGTEHTAASSVDQPLHQPRINESVQPVSMGVSSIVSILMLISLVLGLGVWILYAYRNPHSTSGQILIRYRPSQWSWKRGEARYTAATIHM